MDVERERSVFARSYGRAIDYFHSGERLDRECELLALVQLYGSLANAAARLQRFGDEGFIERTERRLAQRAWNHDAIEDGGTWPPRRRMKEGRRWQ